MEGRLDKTKVIPAAALPRRKSSFMDMVLGANKHGGARTDNEVPPAREMRWDNAGGGVFVRREGWGLVLPFGTTFVKGEAAREFHLLTNQTARAVQGLIKIIQQKSSGRIITAARSVAFWYIFSASARGVFLSIFAPLPTATCPRYNIGVFALL